MNKPIRSEDFVAAVEAMGWLDITVEPSKVLQDRVTVTKRVRLDDGSFVELTKTQAQEDDGTIRETNFMGKAEWKGDTGHPQTSYFSIRPDQAMDVVEPIKRMMDKFFKYKDLYLLLQMKLNKIQNFQRVLFAEEQKREQSFMEIMVKDATT